MNFESIKLSDIKKLVPPVIHERGTRYYEDGMVRDLDYENEGGKIMATVRGSQRNLYSIKVTLEGAHLNTYCTCYYEGSQCKHAVAVLLAFIKNKGTYLSRAREDGQKLESLKEKLMSLSKADLINFILKSAKKSADLKRNLLITFGDNLDLSIKVINKNIESAGSAFEAGNENSNEFAMKLRNIFEPLKDADSKIRLQVAWAIVDKIVGFFNEYGIGYDEALESLLFENLNILAELLAQDKDDRSTRSTVLKGLLAHYLKNNCSVMDDILGAIFENCIEKSDYEMLISEAERAHRDLKEVDSYNKNLVEDLIQDLKDALINIKK